MKVALLWGQHKHGSFAGTSARRFLSDVFGEASIDLISAEEIRYKNPDPSIKFLFMTGTTGEKSPYPDFLSKERGKSLLRWAQQNGAVIWMDCAASYYAMEKIEYTKVDGTILNREGLGWIKGIAKGPHPTHLGIRDTADSSGYEGVITVPISLSDETLSQKPFEIAYGHSPILYPTRDNIGLKIIAHFKDVAENNTLKPVALAVLEQSESRIIICGGLPLIRPDHLDNFTDEHTINLRKTLEEYSDGHHALWKNLSIALGNYYKNLPSIQRLCYGEPS
jgi:glutamine amidotransferase-like uncharacterized protein